MQPVCSEIEGNYTFVGMTAKRGPFDDINLPPRRCLGP